MPAITGENMVTLFFFSISFSFQCNRKLQPKPVKVDWVLEKSHWTVSLTFDSLCSQIDGVRAKIYFKAIPVDQLDGLTYLRVEEAKMDFSVKNIQMGVDNVAGGNVVIRKFSEAKALSHDLCVT